MAYSIKTMKRILRDVGARGGKKAAASMTPEQRTERARKAGIASGKARGMKA